ncbi:putative glycosyl transferase [Escherichia coli]|uniref:Putative glycosyl transferase n=1 Tax=Escherichia coli TaxID=562 RepID=A0A377B8N2_ECOLX|nr:putative glycosyl transferase [Escherichia coli]
MKDNPLISIYMPTWNRQQLAIRAIKSVLRQDYSNWEMIIVDDCSNSWEQLQQYVTALNDPRITYIHNDINSGACAVRNQAIMLAQGEYITGIDDDDEWTPNRLSVFLAHKQQLVTHAFLYANDYVCQGEVYSQPASLPLYPKSPYSRRLFYKRNIIGNQVFTWAWRFKDCLFDTELKAHRITTSSCGWWWSMANRGSGRGDGRSCISITVKCRSPRHRKNSPDTSTFTASTKTNLTVPVKNISCLPSTRSAINV